MSELTALEDWAGALLAKLDPAARRTLITSISRDLRRSQQRRIAAQQNPDGSAFVPRKTQLLRSKKGRIKQKMFTKLRQVRHLKLANDASSAGVAFTGRVARLARVHQYGLRDRPGRGQADVSYPQRQLLGFSRSDLDNIKDALLAHLTT